MTIPELSVKKCRICLKRTRYASVADSNSDVSKDVDNNWIYETSDAEQRLSVLYKSKIFCFTKLLLIVGILVIKRLQSYTKEPEHTVVELKNI